MNMLATSLSLGHFLALGDRLEAVIAERRAADAPYR